jgi:perosamine synthetase
MRTIAFGRPMIGEEEKKVVAEVLNGPILVHGHRAHDFENSFATYTGAPHAVCVSSCTAALHLLYFYLGLGLGDEVIVPAQTHTATAHSVELCNAKPVFVDAERGTGNIDIDQIEAAITSKTKALSVVHYLGMPVNMDRINEVAQKHKLFVVEDCALAIGSYFKGIHMGLHGDAGCFSFYPVKHLTTSEGGMVITKHKEVAQKITRQKAFGVDRHTFERSIPGVYDVTMLGFNYRMSEMQAAIGIEQVKKSDDFLEKRKQNYEMLAAGLKELPELSLFQSTGGDYQSSYYCLSVILSEKLAPKRFEIVQYLKEHGIGTSVYYPRAVPHFTYYKQKYGYADSSYPVASWISSHSIALPVGPHLGVEDMQYIVENFKNALTSIK